jgi:site-specific recombinase XerD
MYNNPMNQKALQIVSNNELDAYEKVLEHPYLFEFFENFDSEHTRRAYHRDIKQFLNYCDDHYQIHKITEIKRVHVIAFKKWLTEIDQAPKTINRKLAANSSFFDFLVEKNVIEANPCNSIRRPKQTVKTPTNDISDEDIQKLLAVLDKQKHESALLHRAIIYTLFTTGIRKSELIELKLKDFVKVKDSHVFNLKVKGGKFLTKLVHPICVEVIEDYLRSMKVDEKEVNQEDWIFQPTKNPLDKNLIKPINPKSIDYIIKKYCKLAGITARISPHSARASYIGSALDNGMDLYRLAQDVGHSSVKTTEEYNKRRAQLKDSAVHHLGFLKKEEK